MNTPNPFQPPSVNVNERPAVPPAEWTGVPPSVIALLIETRPWLRLTLGLLVTVAGLGAAWIVGWSVHGVMRNGRSPFAYGGLLVVVALTFTNVLPAVYLARSAQAIRRLQEGGGLPALEDMLRSQRGFWRYVGILALALIAVYAVAFVLVAGRLAGR